MLGGLALAALAFELSSWAAQRDGFERAQDEPGLSYSAPGPLLDIIVVPGSLIATAIIVIAVVATSRQVETAG